MITKILRRVMAALVVIVGVASLVFLMIHLIPGDPVEIMLGEQAQPADKAQLREQLGLDRPIGVQFISYWGNLLTGDLGHSIHSGKAVTSLLAQRLPVTLHLAVASLLVALVLALPLGVFAAVKKGKAVDTGAMAFSLIGVSIPNFWMGQILILIFAFGLAWFPVSGNDQWSSIVLPALTLGTALAAILSRMTRSTLLDVMHEDYMKTARAKGLKPWQAVLHHGLQNAFLPLLTLLGLQLGALLAGAVITEKVFSWPGIGLLTIEAIQKRDYPVVQGCVLFISLSYVIINTLTDIAYGWIDPRIRNARGSHE